ncbi:MAG TPA: RNA 2',3'-cyclic phosphodiesterase [Phycisphaerae bacterium]|nr:RNA 2',3'-cyclic phosphodiesterase [Phycisphaerae bacterium]HOJ74904.1 RNA 2',3'-cyclic phosphodiesterase [Phycisphaerae bacterium]HOM51465.1 RNA 2',3'-cyclic phosphodiesterase [Phycisphaerae bacterium]HOQ85578.1 RNA 2',3'-cyclic phosphodiesterase [Phycisphaerae bacterium]HPP26993.1 RNA 2',3'-cyclic phosphodiesterase [Phycisphaerae bacterium]
MRCFVAIELPDTVRNRLAELQTQLHGLDRTIRWTRPEQIHITIKFLGEVPDADVPQVCTSVTRTAARMPAIPLTVRGLGVFPPRGLTRIVWAGIDGPPAGLVACYGACEQALAELGFAPETRVFKPHLTLGRARDPRGARDVPRALEPFADFTAGSFTASQLVVFQSVLCRTGPTYTALARADLAGLPT